MLYKQMQELVFETAYAALLDTASPPTQPRIVSAPAAIQ
jgi:hypothetical protein